MKLAVCLFLASLLGCATFGEPRPESKKAQGAGSAGQPSEGPLTIPSNLRIHVEQSEAIGGMLYLQDKASAIGTDVMLENTTEDERRPIGGYLTMRESEEDGTPKPSWMVQFFTKGAEPRIAARIRVFMGPTKPTCEKLSPPAEASPGARLLIRARQTAVAELLKTPRAANQSINPAIFPGEAIGEKGILVYLLAGTNQPHTVVFGQHFRALVSEDGMRVTKLEPLSKSALVMRADPPSLPNGSKTVGLTVSHLVTEWPLETHVFASLLHKMPVYVVTPRFLWKVDGRKISLLETKD
jgi:hypothetical protein